MRGQAEYDIIKYWSRNENYTSNKQVTLKKSSPQLVIKLYIKKEKIANSSGNPCQEKVATSQEIGETLIWLDSYDQNKSDWHHVIFPYI